MPQLCTVCRHPERAEIDATLVNGSATIKALAARYHLIDMSLHRHRAHHLPKAMVKAQEAAEAARGSELLQQLRAIHSKTVGVLLRAEQRGDERMLLSAVREARNNLELLAKLLGELDERPIINLVVTPEWIDLRTRILNALRPYPEARTALSEALKGSGANGHR